MANTTIKYLGHAGFQIVTKNEKVIIIDPWLTGNPSAACQVEEIVKADMVLVTHDHFDHIGDVGRILKTTGATLVGMPEVVGKLKEDAGIPDSQIVFGMGMNIGGTAHIDGIAITMTQASHSCEKGNPAGYIIKLEDGFTIYHAGDTGVFYSMKILGDLYHIDLALLPIGGVFTMDPTQAAMAARLLQVKKVIPMHYKTFPLLEQEALSFKEIMKKEAPEAEVLVLDPGNEYVLGASCK